MADNPYSYSDLLKPDDSIDKAIQKFERLAEVYEESIGKILADLKKFDKELNKVNTSTEAGKTAAEGLSNSVDQLDKQYAKLTQAQSDNGKELARLRSETQKQNQINKLTNKLNNSLEGSYDKLSAQYSLNKIALNKMSKEQRSATKEGQQLEKETAAIYEEMKRLQEATGKHTLSVGDYKKGWEGLKDEIGSVGGPLRKAADGVDGVNDSFKAMLKNPILLLLAGIVGALSALFGAFKKSASGSRVLSKASAALSGAMSALVGLVEPLADFMLRAFEDPQQAVADLWETIKTNLVNRLKGLMDLFVSLGKVVGNTLALDFDAAGAAAKDAGQAFIQMSTGLDTEQQKAYAEGLVETAKRTRELTAATLALEEAQFQTRKTNREITKQIADLSVQQAKYNAIADDTTRSTREQAEAAVKAEELTTKIAELNVKKARAVLKDINDEIKLRKANNENLEDEGGLLDRQADAYVALRAAEQEYTVGVIEQSKRRKEIKETQLERELDYLIDGVDNVKTNNEKIINDDTQTFERRQQLLDETNALLDKSFNAQIATVQEFTDVRIDANDIIATSDAVMLKDKLNALGVDDSIAGRILEIYRDRKSALQDMYDAERKLQQDKAKRDDEEAKQKAEQEKKKLDAAKEAIDQEYDLRISEIDASKDLEAEKTRQRLEAEKDRINKILDLNKQFQNDLSAIEIETLQNTIKKIDNELEALSKEDRDIYSAIGLKLNDEQKGAISEATNFVIGQINEVLDARVAAAEQALDLARDETSAARDRYNEQLALQNQGLANDAAAAAQELETAKAREQDILEEKEKAQKAQLALDTITQTSSLITAASNIWASLSAIPVVGPALAIAAIATMFGSFAASKIKSKNLTEQKFSDGGFEILEGGSHASGNDIPLGINSKGQQRKAEGGEAFAIINKKNTRKYKNLLPSVFNSLNRGDFEESFGKAYLHDDNGGTTINNIIDGEKLRNIDKNLSKISGKKGQSEYINKDGYRVIKRGGLTQIIK